LTLYAKMCIINLIKAQHIRQYETGDFSG